MNRLETIKRFLIKTNEERFASSSRMTTSGGEITRKSLKHILAMGLVFLFDIY